MQAGDGVARPMGDAILEAAGLASITPQRKEFILAGIKGVEAILDGGGLDSAKTAAIGQRLREGLEDNAVAECFLDDGQWDPDQRQFQGIPVWDCVRTALRNLKTTVEVRRRPTGGAILEAVAVVQEERAEENLPVHALSPYSPQFFAPNCTDHLPRPPHLLLSVAKGLQSISRPFPMAFDQGFSLLQTSYSRAHRGLLPPATLRQKPSQP